MKATATKKATKVLTIDQQIKANNAAYKKASGPKRRVMIAKDALEQIKLGKIQPVTGSYVLPHWDGNRPSYTDPLQPFLLDTEHPVSCDCCAKGALFVSCVRLSNRYDGSPIGIGSGGINNLLNWPANNYDTIEAFYEGFYDGGGKGAYNRTVKKWQDKYPDDSDRLEAILRNIVRNNGTFKP